MAVHHIVVPVLKSVWLLVSTLCINDPSKFPTFSCTDDPPDQIFVTEVKCHEALEEASAGFLPGRIGSETYSRDWSCERVDLRK